MSYSDASIYCSDDIFLSSFNFQSPDDAPSFPQLSTSGSSLSAFDDTPRSLDAMDPWPGPGPSAELAAAIDRMAQGKFDYDDDDDGKSDFTMGVADDDDDGMSFTEFVPKDLLAEGEPEEFEQEEEFWDGSFHPSQEAGPSSIVIKEDEDGSDSESSSSSDDSSDSDVDEVKWDSEQDGEGMRDDLESYDSADQFIEGVMAQTQDLQERAIKPLPTRGYNSYYSSPLATSAFTRPFSPTPRQSPRDGEASVSSRGKAPSVSDRTDSDDGYVTEDDDGAKEDPSDPTYVDSSRSRKRKAKRALEPRQKKAQKVKATSRPSRGRGKGKGKGKASTENPTEEDATKDDTSTRKPPSEASPRKHVASKPTVQRSSASKDPRGKTKASPKQQASSAKSKRPPPRTVADSIPLPTGAGVLRCCFPPCSERFDTLDDLKRHTFPKRGDAHAPLPPQYARDARPFRCCVPACDHPSRVAHEAIRHCKNHDKKKFKCQDCDVSLTRADALKRHAKNKHGVIVNASDSVY